MNPLRFNPTRRGAACWLGPLEAEIMAAIWSAGTPVTVKRVWRTLWDDQECAYTTIMTTMVRLVAKKLLARRRVGLAYVYTPALSEQEFIDVQTRHVRDALEG